MKKIEMSCIVCPMSCHLSVQLSDENQIISVVGNQCPRGDAYARQECVHPLRMLTSTVKINHALIQRCPVVSSQEIPKEKMFDVMKEIQKIEVNAPIRINQVLIKDVCHLGVDIISSRSLDVV